MLAYGAIFVVGEVRGRLGRNKKGQSYDGGAGKIHGFDSSVKHGDPLLNAWQSFSGSIGRLEVSHPSSLRIQPTARSPADA